MTPEEWREAKEIYFTVCDAPEDRREEVADRLCRGRAEIRGAVAELLGAARAPESFLETPALGEGFDISRGCIGGDEDDAVGLRLGPYQVERKVGVGGMGAVYLASRVDGEFEQRVAIKLVKRGLDTDEILDRFRHERQLLARLDHPNIARLLDGGATPDGRPYLAMEYVDGRPIDRYCKEEELDIEARVRLFCQVCDAVQYAHQNLVVHRDLKPGNVLITAQGVPKLLDFGIAKVLEREQGTGADVTVSERRLLTPGFASPEQVLGRPVSTVSDVYSLGVILYHLLTGDAPYRFTTGTDREIERLVCEVDPPAPGVAAGRSAHSARLARRLAGDLDNIVLMAMRKEPDRRYASAEQLAADLRRHLDGHPVIARPSTLAYRMSKFVRRNRLAVAGAAALGLVVTAGVSGVVWQARIARAQRDRAVAAHAEADQINAFLQSILQSANAFAGSGRDVTVRETLEGAAGRARAELAGQPAVLASVLGAVGSAYTSLGLFEEAEPLLREAVALARDLPPGSADLPSRLNDLATLLYSMGSLDEAGSLVRESLDIEVARSGRQSAGAARTLNNLGAILRAEGRLDDAEAALREALSIRRTLLGPDDLAVAETLNNLANVVRMRNDLPGAEELLRGSLAVRERVLGDDHPLVAQSLSNLAVIVHSEGELDRAAPLYERALRLQKVTLGEDHPDHASTLFSYGMLKRMQGDDSAATAPLKEALEIRQRILPDGDPRTIRSEVELARCLSALGQHDEAIRLLLASKQAVEDSGGREDLAAYVTEALAGAYEAAGDPDHAAKVRGEGE